jgi:hypothetical protein
MQIFTYMGSFTASEQTPKEIKAAVKDARVVLLDGVKSGIPFVQGQALQWLTQHQITESIPKLISLIENPGALSVDQLAVALERQGSEPRIVEAFERVLRSGATPSEGVLRAYRETAGPKALPLLRELERKLRNQKRRSQTVRADWLSAPGYGSLIEALVRLKDDETVEQQIAWLLSEEAADCDWIRWPMGERLRKEMSARIAADGAKQRRDVKRQCFKWLFLNDADAGMKALIVALKAEDRDVALALYDVYWISFPLCYKPEDFQTAARNVERWWQLENGRDPGTLRQDALFP